MPSFFAIGPPVPEKMFEGFLPYMGMATILSWSCDLAYIYIFIDTPILLMLQIKFGFDWPSGFRREDVEYYGDIHVYCPGCGGT